MLWLIPTLITLSVNPCACWQPCADKLLSEESDRETGKWLLQGRCPLGRPLLLSHLFQVIGSVSKVKLAVMMSQQTKQRRLCRGGFRKRAWYTSKARAQWALFWNTFSSHIRRWQVIREDFHFRGDDGQRTSSLPPSTFICPLWPVG